MTVEIVESERHMSTTSVAQKVKRIPKHYLELFTKSWLQKVVDLWMLHELSQVNLMNRITILLNRSNVNPFLKGIVFDDEKWDSYNNTKRKRS